MLEPLTWKTGDGEWFLIAQPTSEGLLLIQTDSSGASMTSGPARELADYLTRFADQADGLITGTVKQSEPEDDRLDRLEKEMTWLRGLVTDVVAVTERLAGVIEKAIDRDDETPEPDLRTASDVFVPAPVVAEIVLTPQEIRHVRMAGGVVHGPLPLMTGKRVPAGSWRLDEDKLVRQEDEEKWDCKKQGHLMNQSESTGARYCRECGFVDDPSSDAG